MGLGLGLEDSDSNSDDDILESIVIFCYLGTNQTRIAPLSISLSGFTHCGTCLLQT
ncbi:hypothetical protein JHK82_048239 [Glycine max]|uniref:Uncharacterized protein n=1 Tax=Glycine soja TaxID=3848 RepID=A0A0B2S878_GLYSO|nr:hypothetical protein JHK85_048738 [Glycine max]KAG5098385.1 hypothetical protein JHK82_048239 [Glycine max]KAG5103176.1 hypothetical protein JHK84_048145 [Glycine max]KHN42886.1 hypothetical protein glysoja_044534 [Glycine soja]